MAYVEGRTVHDADAHIMETPELLETYVEEKYRAAVRRFDVFRAIPRYEDKFAEVRLRQDDPAWRADDAKQILLRKNWDALGSWRREDRPAALDHLGFASQLVFNTMLSGFLSNLEHGDDLDLAYASARAHNRAMVEFCAVDRRLLATGYVPLADPARAVLMADEAISFGCKALLIPSRCPKDHSPSHIALDGVWARAQEAGLPVVFHVGGGGPLLSPAYFVNGLPPVPDFHGGAENFRSVDYMAIPYPPMQTLATLIIDRVLDRFPRLKFGVIEQGASWLPGWMRAMDSAHAAFYKNEERLQKMSLRPSEYVRRQVRVTPYPHEDTAWIVANAGDEVCLFSSDFPHVEGGRNPMKRFADALARTPDAARQRFYCDNFIDLMGRGLPPDIRRTANAAA
ncbi:MAG TPA: amidohydrolase family protein [Candidatus Cybelea sp.]|nr:amidohydrolase family protein [Candidatus Cybelea sp.]